MSTSEFQAVETQVEPLLAAARDAVFQNAQLFARIKALHEDARIKALHEDAGALAALTPEQTRLLDVTFKNFKRRGALLSDAEKPEVASINQVNHWHIRYCFSLTFLRQELSSLFTQFCQNLLKSEEAVTEVCFAFARKLLECTGRLSRDTRRRSPAQQSWRAWTPPSSLRSRAQMEP
jgi:peptidyl-dipeptidase Dcp